MINIGVDPRMLSLVTHPRPPRRITIDGYQYPLLLDRVQPVIKVGDQFHAIRFRCEKLHAMIDDRTFAINGTGYSRIYVGSRTHLACLGGPGHELVINGKPHTVPFGSHVTFINISYNSIGVRFVGETPQNVDVLPAIPPRLLKWAAEGYFGSPAHLYKPPFNPLKEMHRIADQRTQQLETNGECGSSPSEPVVQSHQQMQSNQAHIRMQLNNNELGSDNSQLFPLQDAPQTQKIDIHSLFQKLVEAGIVSRPEAKAEPPKEPPLLTEYSWEKFRLPFVLEVDSLYGGEQCVHCGLRFVNEHSKEYASHLDYHYVKKSTEAENQGRSRNFYQPYRYWLMSEITRDGGPQLENCSPIDNIPECKCKAFTEPSLNLCSVCFEKFEEFWDHEEEEWMLRNAVMIDGKAYHPICQEDAGKQFAATSPPHRGHYELIPSACLKY
ncbi:unnamed protein product [Protopolystoma xenopodis]|uniref:PCFS4-like zinc finger domain-containing protein n=1 Tax=Protopolystoma xenopodis TaxID=117903 RepID=A0A448WUT1_9PLAT|nr:unnamed protein product [Protopolystoma xenopodis]